jgi:hypothetical protein
MAVIAMGLATVWPVPSILSGGFSRFGPEGSGFLVRTPPGVAATSGEGSPSSAAAWFEEAKASCNPVEVRGHLLAHPAPAGFEGTAHAAACLALAGQIDEARNRILELDPNERWRAAGVVFGAGHPAADAGDEVAAGPLMEMVVEFWPDHYMALYHAGAARYQNGDLEPARSYLERFLENYDANDGWTRSAREMLAGPAERRRPTR